MYYKLKWNEELKVFTVISYEKGDEKEPKSNLVGENDGSVITNSQVANLLSMAATTLVADGEITVEKCKECGLYFTVSKEDESWYSQRGLEPPKRCYCCRQYRKRRKKFAEEED